MSAVPVEVTEAAAALVATFGMQQELERMLDWVREHVTGLREIRVAKSRNVGYSRNLPPILLIWASRGKPPEGTPYHLIEWDFSDWKAQTFPLQICTSSILMCTYQPLANLPV